ncbi:MAG: hypothetical protein J0I20_13105 [Chloroflexi bacterium]|nr:hypothetical protein [Chloroflexota bacterium]OJV92618.1 MAG: hypothetical protein BGO39_32615 [Chloroflexi bacterium 54-19]
MKRPNSSEEQEATRLEDYLSALRHDPAAKPSGELDPLMAEVTRLTLESEREKVYQANQYVEAARKTVWQKVLTELKADHVANSATRPALSGPLSTEKPGKFENGLGPAYLLPNEPVRKTRQINWPRIALSGMAATIVVILGIFGLLLLTQAPQTTPGVIGSGGITAKPNQATQPTAALVAATQTPQPTPTPYPAYKITLQVAADSFTGSQAQATAKVLENRMLILGFVYAKASVDGNTITLNLRGAVDTNFEFKTVTTVGRIEFVNAAGSKFFKAGDYLRTSYCTSGSLLKPQKGLCVPTAAELSPNYSPIGYTTEDGKPFQTIVTGEDMDISGVKLAKDDNGNEKLEFKFKPDAATVMKNYTESSLGQQMAITVDNTVILNATVQGVISDTGEITSPSKMNMTNLIAFLKSGPLPLPLYFIGMS